MDKSKFDLTKFYDELAKSWDKTRPEYILKIFKEIITRLDKNKTQSILDFGCGTGLFCKYVEDNFHNTRIEGIDISSQMIDKAKANCPVCQFYAGDIFQINLPTYDAVVSKDVFNHIPDISKTVTRLNELINPEGTIIIANREREFNTEKEITAVLKSLNYQVVAEHFNFKPNQEEIDSFLKTLIGFEERHKSVIKEKLANSGKYYIISAKKPS